MASIYRSRDKWRVQIRRSGQSAISETFDTKQQAQRWARDMEVKMDKTILTPAPLRVTIADLADTYLSQVDLPKHSTKLRTIKRLRERMGTLRLAELTRQSVTSYIQQRENEGAGPATLIHDFTYLQTVLRFGGVMCDVEEAADVALLRVRAAKDILKHSGRVKDADQRERRPSDAELEKLKNEFLAPSKSAAKNLMSIWDITLFAIATAMRLGEILRITWEDFDKAGRMILIRDRKDPKKKEGNHQRVPLLSGHFKFDGEIIDPVEIMLRRSYRRGIIFPYNRVSVSKKFQAGATACGIKDLRFHDLRHDGVSRLFEAGYDIPRVALVSGHKKWETLRKYTNLRPESLHEPRADV